MKEYLEYKPEVFEVRLFSRWGIRMLPKAITTDNSGIESYNNYRIEDLETNINNMIKKLADSIIKIRKIQKY